MGVVSEVAGQVGWIILGKPWASRGFIVEMNLS